MNITPHYIFFHSNLIYFFTFPRLHKFTKMQEYRFYRTFTTLSHYLLFDIHSTFNTSLVSASEHVQTRNTRLGLDMAIVDSYVAL